MSTTTNNHIRKVVKAEENEQNRIRKASANAAAKLTKLEQEQVNQAKKRIAERQKKVNENFENAMNFLMGKGGRSMLRSNNRKTRRSKRKNRQTRKH